MIRSLQIAAALIAASFLPTAHSSPNYAGMRMKRIAVPPEIAQLSTAELIERLQDFAGYTGPIQPLQPKIPKIWQSGPLRSPDLDWTFIPLESPAEGYFRDGKRFSSSPVLVELVARGIESVPLLLEHLTDARPTRSAQTVRFMIGGPVGFADQYDPRDRTRGPEPNIVNTVRVETLRPIGHDPYIIRVGDLCYYALGQIVNRRLNPVGRSLDRSFRVLTINSPLENFALAAVACAEWSGLTREEHRSGLLADARADDTAQPSQLGELSLRRLLFYYPATGIEEAGRRLDAPLTIETLGPRQSLVTHLAEFEWPGIDEHYARLLSRTARLSVADAGQRFSRDELVLDLAKRLPHERLASDAITFLTEEIAWWRAWQKQTAAAPWFNKSGPMAAWSNLWPVTQRWCDGAAVVVNEAQGLSR